ncbi:thiamine pyrophosphate-dependent enzyme [Xinfangfangia pollutisoli]|uniref:thiamine pyrophosphate-dependent enzyme n=1 Tax=Xinfangfangia pollutisoli TaxID=2865960 RepID=UPI001CD6622B|nr:thiamine pyrophosphate-dependent enzyme [Xinfangfangia pollutisoli]
MNQSQPLAGVATSDRSNLPDAAMMLGLYEQMVLLRKFETVAQAACRKGETPGFLHLYLGQEASAVGVCAHLERGDWVTSTHRGHGHALAKGANPARVMAELFGRADGICGGRGGTMHLYDRSVGLFGTNGVVGAGIGQAVGIGLGARALGTRNIGVTFFGDGASNHGAFHEALNFAAVQRAPTIFVCENNLYATATPLRDVTLNTDIASKAASYGMPGIAVDGNDVLAVHAVMAEAVRRARAGEGPTLIETRTYRTVGHHEGDPVTGTYRSQDEVDLWKSRDPIDRLRARLVDDYRLASQDTLASIDARIDAIVAEALDFARRSPLPDPASVRRHVFAEPLNPPCALAPAVAAGSRVQGWLEAVRDGIAEEMRRDPAILYFGEGTGERGGSFAHTKNLWAEFGAERMVDTPISEQAFTAAAIGASAIGARTVSDVMFADFAFEAAGQILLQAAKLRYMSNGGMNAPFVLRAGAGALRSSGPHHSGSYHPIFAQMPGLVVCVPSNPADAKGLMKTALRAADPVVMLEPKALFATKGEVPLGDHYVPFGVARIARTGRDITIVATGQLVGQALIAAETLAAAGIEAEIIDPRTIMPFDIDCVVESLRKTHRLLIVDEAWAMCGLGGEIAQAINELAFDDLDAPPGRLHTDPVSHPFAPVLEQSILVSAERIVRAAQDIIAGIAPVPDHWLAQRGPRPAAAATAAPAPVPGPTPAPMAVQSAGRPGEEDILMPFGDLTVSEGTLVRWAKALGDSVAAGELVAEIETDKAVVEIEAPVGGTVTSIEAAVGQVIPMGGRIGGITP